MLTTDRISSNIETVRDKNLIQKKLMNNLHSYRNYIQGTELENGKILLYAGKTRRSVEERKQGKFATGAIPQGDGSYIQSAWGYDGRLFDTIHVNNGTKNDKLLEQKHINTVRAVAKLLPEVIVAGNVNNDGFYGDKVSSISPTVYNKIVAWVQGTRTMTEKRMVANKRKLARKLAQVKRARQAKKANA